MRLLRYEENRWLIIIHRIRRSRAYQEKYYGQRVSKAFLRSINTPQESDRNMGRSNLTYEITPNRSNMLIDNIIRICAEPLTSFFAFFGYLLVEIFFRFFLTAKQ